MRITEIHPMTKASLRIKGGSPFKEENPTSGKEGSVSHNGTAKESVKGAT